MERTNQFKLRRGVFETNSSSVHVIGIVKENKDDLQIPESISFVLDEFGWEYGTYSYVVSKASYLYTMAYLFCYLYNEDYSFAQNKTSAKKLMQWCANMTAMLNSMGVLEVNFQYVSHLDMFQPENSEYDANGFKNTYAYIDHSEGVEKLFKELSEDSDKLKRFLFDERSVIRTGNDNDDNERPSECFNDDVEIIYKDN